MRARKDKPAMKLVETGRATSCRRLGRKGNLAARIKSVIDAHENVALITYLWPLFFVLEQLIPRRSDGSDNDIRSCVADSSASS